MDATPHIIESALLLLAAFLIGCVIGYFVRRVSGVRPSAPVAAKAVAPDEAVVAVEESTPGSTPEAVVEPEVAATPVKAPRKARAATVKSEGVAATHAEPKAKKVVTPDDLKKIKGIGPRLEAALNSHGVTRYAQIAKWSKKTIAELDAELSLRGRIEREQWVEQAKALVEK